MKILHRYVLRQLVRNFMLCMLVSVLLFILFDFFDRIDNILAEGATVGTILQYFLFKIPLMLALMCPIAMMTATLVTLGLLSKNSELTAMRASGATVFWIASPVLCFGVFVSIAAVLINETLVPYTQRRSREIYNIDIRQKDKSGGYSQRDFWWRSKDTLYSVGMFDSRTNTLHDVSVFEMEPNFRISKRTMAPNVSWVHPSLGWSMERVAEWRFDAGDTPTLSRLPSLPLPIAEKPKDFYDTRTDQDTMSFRQMRRFIAQQQANGLSVSGYLPYLYEKFSFPLINFLIVLVVLPFALKPARSGSLASGVVAGLVVGFSYYAIHSFSLAMGKAEILSPFLAAWMANILMGFVGSVLMLGAEAP